MIRRFTRDEQGASAVEFAIVLTPMTLVFLGIMQFGHMLFVYNDMFNAAREAARRWASNDAAVFAAGGTTTCGTQAPNSVEDAACQNVAQWTLMTFSVTPVATETASGACEEIRVDVSVPMVETTFVNLFGLFDAVTLTASATMRSQYDILEGGTPVSDADCD